MISRNAIMSSMSSSRKVLLDVDAKSFEEYISGHSKRREGESKEEMQKRSKVKKAALKNRQWLRQLGILPSPAELHQRAVETV